MTLLNFVELIPPNEESLKDSLYSNLKSQSAWRYEKSDAVNDQLKYFDSYFGKEQLNSHIDKELISQFLKEGVTNNPSHGKGKQINNTFDKRKFVGINETKLCENNPNENNILLHFLDCENTKHNSKFLKFTLNQTESDNDMNNETESEQSLELSDELKLNLDFDTKLRSVVNENEKIHLMDMYSLYKLQIDSNNEDLALTKFEKVITLKEIPNYFLSDSCVGNFFISSFSSSSQVALFNSDYLNLNTRALTSSSPVKGIFINHPMNLLLHNQEGITILDFRSSSPHEKKLNSQIINQISDVRLLEDFKYIVFSTKTVSLFDMRFPQLPVSQFPLNIYYSSLQLKNVTMMDEWDNLSNFNKTHLLGYDKDLKGNSVLLFDLITEINDCENELEFFKDFIDVKFFPTKFDVVDSTAVIKDNLFINFGADEFGALYSSTYRITNCNNYSQSKVDKVETNSDCFGVADIKDSQIIKLYENTVNNSVYNKKEKKADKVKSQNNVSDDNSLSSDSELDEYLDSGDEEQNDIEFGTAKVNGKEKKMWTLENKRKVLVSLCDSGDRPKYEDDIEMKQIKQEENFEESHPELEMLFDLLEDNLQYGKYYN